MRSWPCVVQTIDDASAQRVDRPTKCFRPAVFRLERGHGMRLATNIVGPIDKPCAVRCRFCWTRGKSDKTAKDKCAKLGCCANVLRAIRVCANRARPPEHVEPGQRQSKQPCSFRSLNRMRQSLSTSGAPRPAGSICFKRSGNERSSG